MISGRTLTLLAIVGSNHWKEGSWNQPWAGVNPDSQTLVFVLFLALLVLFGYIFTY